MVEQLQPALPNPDLKWESTAQLDIGADMTFANGRISATVDYYRKKTKDLLLNIPVGDWWGFTTQIVNAGSIQNSGLELSLNTQNIAKGSFRWKTSLNIGYNKQKVLSLGDRPYIITQTANPYGGRAIDFTKLEKGQELSSFFGIQICRGDQNGRNLYAATRRPGRQPQICGCQQ
jgi:outer membrane receptor protein involved in Fe transport